MYGEEKKNDIGEKVIRSEFKSDEKNRTYLFFNNQKVCTIFLV